MSFSSFLLFPQDGKSFGNVWSKTYISRGLPMILYVLEEYDHYLLSVLENGNEKADFIPVWQFFRHLGMNTLFSFPFVRSGAGFPGLRSYICGVLSETGYEGFQERDYVGGCPLRFLCSGVRAGPYGRGRRGRWQEA
jgi:hypothetical protein